MNIIEKRKEYYLKNRDKIIEYSKKYSKNNIEGRKKYKLKKKYGITEEEYQKILLKQNYVCAICELPEVKISLINRRLAVDHDHKTGKIRGLLCSRCNRSLSLFENDNPLFNKILKYLKDRN